MKLQQGFVMAKWVVIEIDTSIIIGENCSQFSIRLPMKDKAWSKFPKSFLKESCKPNKKKLCIPSDNYVRINFVDSTGKTYKHIYKSSKEFAKLFE